jgi:hypothetical protein
MKRILPPLHEGHAPIFLHQAFEEALEAYESWSTNGDEPVVDLDERPVPISAVFGRMRTCTDLLPARILDDVLDIVGRGTSTFGGDTPTYAQAAFVMRALCVERLRQQAAA